MNAWTYDHVTVRRVVDGDTVDLDIDLGFSIHAYERFRLARINTPERGQPGYAEATAALAARLVGQLVVVVTGRDKYGRWLAELYDAEGDNINDSLLADGLAQPYA